MQCMLTVREWWIFTTTRLTELMVLLRLTSCHKVASRLMLTLASSCATQARVNLDKPMVTRPSPVTPFLRPVLASF